MGEIINVFINRSLASIKHPSPSETLGWGPADPVSTFCRTRRTGGTDRTAEYCELSCHVIVEATLLCYYWLTYATLNYSCFLFFFIACELNML